ncbi:TIGR02117 family protein [Rhizobium sp. Root708]|uniref:TIGR02117 family protein n=1 Tax=Rhizobium sp. Root708 TaxID=1736592 RepID=UPI0009E990CE|nr:TIGR02117 family protein [Rhizobium sp. Root708]
MRFLRALSVAVLVVGAVVIAGIAVPRWVSSAGASGHSGSARILVLSNPIHTDIAVPVDEDLLARFGFLRNAGLVIDHPDVRYIVFGWGGRSFYTETPTWADLKAMPVAQSFTLDRSVMHVSLAGDIPLGDPAVTAFGVTAAHFDRLLGFIGNSFSKEGGTAVPLVGFAYGNNDAFFEAKGYFNAFIGCNTWTAAGLRQAGLTSGWWLPLPWMLRLSLWLHNPPDAFVQSGLNG